MGKKKKKNPRPCGAHILVSNKSFPSYKFPPLPRHTFASTLLPSPTLHPYYSAGNIIVAFLEFILFLTHIVAFLLLVGCVMLVVM